MQLKYNWSLQPETKNHLERIYANTLYQIVQSDYPKTMADEIINDIEDFIQCYYMSNYDINKLHNWLQKFEYVSVLPKNQRNVPVKNNGTNILINPDIKPGNILTSRERRRTYLYHGIVHNVLNFKNDSTKEFSKVYDDILRFRPNKAIIRMTVENGWLLLEDVISQEIAERFSYYVAKKTRPYIVLDDFAMDENIVNSGLTFGNIEMYREFQSILYAFGQTIRGICNLSNHSAEMITYEMIKKAINTNFSSDIIKEYTQTGNTFMLYKLLHYMGLLINAKQQTFGSSYIPFLITTEAENNKIYRDLMEETRRLITFDSPIKYNDIDLVKEYPSLWTKKKVLELADYKILESEN